ncbi:MAG TPA: hypothetical protein VIJ75_06110 [Hanamia sp.]
MKKNILFRLIPIIFVAFVGNVCKSQSVQLHKIHITDFNVSNDGNKVEINWATDRSEATNYFEVEKSNDGREFKTVAVVMGPDPSKTDCDCYGCVDKINTKTKAFYYRLKHIDTNGTVEISGIKMITLK